MSVFLSALVPFRCSIDKLCRSEGRFGQGQELTAEFELDPLEERQRIQRCKTERNRSRTVVWSKDSREEK